MTYKILVFSSNPTNTQYLAGLTQEYRAIEKARKGSQNPNKFLVERINAARIKDLQKAILKEEPRIVHFCGHGLGDGGIVWETESGGQQSLNTEALAEFFEIVKDKVECIILNTCLSQTQAEAIHQHINYVIGTKSIVKDSAAVDFSESFYQGLFNQGTINDKSIKRAYDLGINRIQLPNKNDSSSGRKLIPVNTPEERLTAVEVFTFLVKEPLTKFESDSISETLPKNIPSNLNQRGSDNFVGREEQLKELHELIQQNEKVTISAIAGMGGIGKTELALQYAKHYQEHYLGGLCWFPVRSENLGTQIIEYARTSLKISVPDELETDLAKVKYCWSQWNKDPSLVVLDDVSDYGDFYGDSIEPYLPPVTSSVKVLMTSREIPAGITNIDLDVLSEEAAIKLLKLLIDKDKVEAELEVAKELCKWLGYLPLGLELVGRYIALDKTLSIEKALKRIKRDKLEARALDDPKQRSIVAQTGVKKALDLSWKVLSPEAQELASYLGLFASEPFKWAWVESAWIETEDEDEQDKLSENLSDLRNNELGTRSLLKAVPNSFNPSEYNFQLHSLVAEYFQAKLEKRNNATRLKQKFCRVIKLVAQTIGYSPTLQEIKAFSTAIPHLGHVTKELTEFVDDEDLIWAYVGLGRYYEGQGIYEQAVEWFEECLTICRKRLGEEHSSVATSLNNLAALYYAQGKYEDAKPLYLKALELRKQLLGEEHPYVATSLNNLAALYHAQGKYNAAEPLYLKALEISRKALGEKHLDVAQSFNNLALLYYAQRKYADAEPLCLKALELRRQLLEEEHPDVAQSFNNLALLYYAQGKYEDAELFFQQALKLSQKLLGEDHPATKTIKENLQYCMTMIYLKMPEAEMRKVLPPEVCEQLLQYKQQLESES